jgi:hypothetical protein
MTLGARYRDIYTGFEGTLTVITDFIGGDSLGRVERDGSPSEMSFSPGRLVFADVIAPAAGPAAL